MKTGSLFCPLCCKWRVETKSKGVIFVFSNFFPQALHKGRDDLRPSVASDCGVTFEEWSASSSFLVMVAVSRNSVHQIVLIGAIERPNQNPAFVFIFFKQFIMVSSPNEKSMFLWHKYMTYSPVSDATRTTKSFCRFFRVFFVLF